MMQDGDVRKKDNSYQGGLLILASSTGLHTSPVSLIEWRSWKLKRVCRSSRSSEAQAQSEALDQLNYIRLFWSEILLFKGVNCHRQDDELAKMPPGLMVTDCKSLFDAVERHQEQGLGLSEKRTAVEVLAIRQISKATNITTKWVNSDRRLADILTKDSVNPGAIQRMLSTRS